MCASSSKPLWELNENILINIQLFYIDCFYYCATIATDGVRIKKKKTSSPINSSRMVLTWRAVLCRGRSIFDHCHLSWTSCCQLFGPGRCLEKYPGVCLQRVIKLSLFPAWQIEASTDSNVLRAHLPRRSRLHSRREDSWLLFGWLSLPFSPPSVPSAVKMSAVFYLWELATIIKYFKTLKKKKELTQYMLLLRVVVVIANCIAEVWLYT